MPERTASVEPKIRSAVEVVQAGCAESIAALKKYYSQAIRFEEEPIHQMRVGTRRLRAALSVFSALMDDEWAAGLESELRWLAHLLGSVRDLDVLRNRLKDSAKNKKPAYQLAIKSIDRVLAERHREAKKGMKEGLENERYAALLARLDEARLAPQMALEAQAPARDVLLVELRKSWKKLKRKADKLKQGDEAIKFHAVRKSGKRIRYSTELILEDFDISDKETAEKFIKKMKKLQDTLGEFQDATVAISTVELLMERKKPVPKSYTVVIDHEKKEQSKARKKFAKAWNNAKSLGNKKWMSGS